MNESSRLATLAAAQAPQTPASLVELDAAAGFVREWNFRAPSGFTAVGVRAVDEPQQPISGVLFEVDRAALTRFDSREAGYERVRLDPSHLRAVEEGDADGIRDILEGSGSRFWMYVPQETHAPDEEHPICQTYVDTCLLGLIERGGRALATSWVQATGGWSEYWLNDAPLSRRPWLHRPRHAEIDACLQDEAAHTRFDERRHPEEFSGRWMASLRGTWGLAPRNAQFVGRELELARAAAALSSAGGGGADGGGRSGGGGGGSTTEGSLSILHLVGMGGVGKTQLANEFCYRHYGRTDGRTGTPSRTARSARRPRSRRGTASWSGSVRRVPRRWRPTCAASRRTAASACRDSATRRSSPRCARGSTARAGRGSSCSTT